MAAPRQDAGNGRGANPAADDPGARPAANASKAADAEKAGAAAPTVEDRLKALEQLIERQQREIQTLRQQLEQRAGQDLTVRRAEPRPETAQPAVAAASGQPAPAAGSPVQTAPPAPDKRLDDLYKNFGALRVSGDIRFRAESFNNQGFDALNEPADRYRLRVRARLAIAGDLDKEKRFSWGLRLATNIFTDPISTNQTLTDFYERKPFALERAFIKYDSRTPNVGVELVAGKFEPTFRRTQLVWDDDVNVEGASEALYFKTKSPLRQVKLVAFQLPFSEVSGGKDGVLYGGQAQTDWRFSSKFAATMDVAYYDWVRADQVLFGLGAAATQVNGGISNGAGVSGNQNGALGTTNRIRRNAAGVPIGFVANFHLLDVLANLTWEASPRYPVRFVLDYVRNVSGRINNEEDGYWAGVQVGWTSEPGDWLAGYTFARIEQDAVLVPFNFSDILASNSRAHIPTFAYQIAHNVTFQWTGLFSRRVNRVVPLSPVNRYLNRMQFDVSYRF